MHRDYLQSVGSWGEVLFFSVLWPLVSCHCSRRLLAGNEIGFIHYEILREGGGGENSVYPLMDTLYVSIICFENQINHK